MSTGYGIHFLNKIEFFDGRLLRSSLNKIFDYKLLLKYLRLSMSSFKLVIYLVIGGKYENLASTRRKSAFQ